MEVDGTYDDETPDWMPTQLKVILNAEDIDVIHLSEARAKDVEQDLLSTRFVGFSTICELEDDLNDSAIIVCFTTRRGVYVMDPRVPSHSIFIVNQFKNEEITFFSLDSRWNAYTMLKQFGVEFQDRHLDLVSMDIYLTLHRKNVTGVLGRDNKLWLSYFTTELKREALEFEQLCAKYLDLTHVDLMICQDDKKSLGQYPFDVIALNTIKKKAGLMWVLTDAIVNEYKTRMRRPSKTIFSFAKDVTGETAEAYERSNDRTYGYLWTTIDSNVTNALYRNGYHS